MDWISVEERLPEVSEEFNYSEVVLVTVVVNLSSEELGYKYVCEAQLTHNGVWLSQGDMLEQSRNTRVIGWMPMPEAMKEFV